MSPVLQRGYTAFTVKIPEIASSAVITALRVLKVDESLGGDILNTATLGYDLGPYSGPFLHIENCSLTALPIVPDGSGGFLPGNIMGAKCYVYKTNPGGSPELIHVGFINVDNAIINQEEERLEFVSRLDRAAYGTPLLHQRVMWIYPFSGSVKFLTYIGEPCVFNPEVDGVIFANRRGIEDPLFPRPLFIHPESIRTPPAAAFQQSPASVFDPTNPDSDGWLDEVANTSWLLADVVEYLCVECNPDQTVITNPLRSELDAALSDSPSLVKNLTVPPGTYLMDALDMVLEPYGYTWKLEYSTGNPKIAVMRKGYGDEPLQQLYLQAVGEPLDPSDFVSNTPDFNVMANLGSVVNQIQIFGAPMQIEATFELVPAWSADDDDLGWTFLMKDDIAGNWKANPQYHRVHRDWVLNEGGDYIGLRAGLDQPFDFGPLFEQAFGSFPRIAQRRRRFLPTLTVIEKPGSSPGDYNGGVNQPIGMHGGCQIQYFNYDKGEWIDLPSGQAWWECQILQSECGIRFSGTFPPFPLVSDVRRGRGRVRITATVTSDTLVRGFAERQAGSLSPRPVEQLLDMQKSFHARQVVRSGSGDRWFPSIYSDPMQYQALEADGRSAAQELAVALRSSWDMADISGHCQLEGCDRDQYKLGTQVPQVGGRDISMFATGSVSLQMPLIVRRVWLPEQNQRTLIYLETARPTVDTMLNRVAIDPALHSLRKKHRISPKKNL